MGLLNAVDVVLDPAMPLRAALALQAVLPHVEELRLRVGEADAPVVLVIGGERALDLVDIQKPGVAFFLDADEPLSPERLGRLQACRARDQRSRSSASAGAGVKDVGPVLPQHRAAPAGDGLALVGRPDDADEVAGAARAAGMRLHVAEAPEDVLPAVRGAKVVCGPWVPELAAACSLWGKPLLVPATDGRTGAHSGWVPSAAAAALAGPLRARIALEPEPSAVAATGTAFPGAGPRVARQLRQAVLAPF